MTPQEVGLGRLLHQHAETILDPRAALAGPAHEDGRLGGIHHVVGERLRREQRIRQRRQLAAQRCAGAIDDQIELTLDGRIAATGQLAAFPRQVGEVLGQRTGLGGGAIGDHQCRRLLGQQRFQHTTHGATRAENQDARTLERRLETLEITGQADTIGGIAIQLTCLAEHQRIDGAGATGTRAQHIDQPEGLLLEGHGDIRPLAAFGDELGPTGREVIGRRQPCLVAQRVLELLSEGAMNQRGFRVGNRVAEYSVTGHQDSGSITEKRQVNAAIRPLRPASRGHAGSHDTAPLRHCLPRARSRTPSAPPAASTSGSTRYVHRSAGQTACRGPRPD